MLSDFYSLCNGVIFINMALLLLLILGTFCNIALAQRLEKARTNKGGKQYREKCTGFIPSMYKFLFV